jgi:hypothetical protein
MIRPIALSDRKTFLLVVVDGRTDASIGMYGTELAATMKKLGAWEAFNLDGGGSSQMWVKGKGTVNDADGNNNGGGLRAVVNHWGILAGAPSGTPVRPGHCVSEPPCEVLGPGGGVLDDQGACFHLFGTKEYWRTENKGYDGKLHWTNAWKTSTPDNWAWWRVHLQEGGEYLVEYYAVPEFAVFKKTHYVVRAGGASQTLTVDQSVADGWASLGTFTFAGGGDQWVAVYDDTSSTVADDQHIVADAIRLTRVGPWCGNAVCDGSETCDACPGDCGACPWCGDGACNAAESCGDCPADCGDCPTDCGNGTCGQDESCSGCPADCGDCPTDCGNGTCGQDESCSDCPEDCGKCPTDCGNGTCGQDESCSDCPEDCGKCTFYCGDGLCLPDSGETCQTCPEDCPVCGEELDVFIDYDAWADVPEGSDASGDASGPDTVVPAGDGYPAAGSDADSDAGSDTDAGSGDSSSGCTVQTRTPAAASAALLFALLAAGLMVAAGKARRHVVRIPRSRS